MAAPEPVVPSNEPPATAGPTAAEAMGPAAATPVGLVRLVVEAAALVDELEGRASVAETGDPPPVSIARDRELLERCRAWQRRYEAVDVDVLENLAH